MEINKRQSDVINILKGTLPFLVVALHTSMATDLDYRIGGEPFLRVLIIKLGDIAVPSFFVISGFLFFNNLKEWSSKVWKDKLTKRVRSLLVPFLLWTVIAFAAKFLWNYLEADTGNGLLSLKQFFCDSGGLRIFWDRPQNTYESSIFGYLVDTSKPIDGPLWYIRDLMVLVLLSPLIWKILKTSRRFTLIGLALVYFLSIGFPVIFVSPTALFFFSLGSAISINGKDILSCFGRFKRISYLFAIVFLTITYLPESSVWVDLSSRLFVFFSVIAVFNLADDLYDHGVKPVKLFSDSSFFVYASHVILITEISNFILWRIFPITAEWMMVLKVFLRPAVAVGLCLLIFVVMKKVCPRILGLLTGGRY